MSKDQKLGRVLQGTVVSNKMDKTVVVQIVRKVMHPMYKKYVRRATKMHAHDANNICQIGDVVAIKETKPMAKTKAWVLAEIIEKAEG